MDININKRIKIFELIEHISDPGFSSILIKAVTFLKKFWGAEGYLGGEKFSLQKGADLQFSFSGSQGVLSKIKNL